MENIDKAFKLFGKLMQCRFERILNGEAAVSDIHYESEDTIRYMMFHALTSAMDIQPEFVFLEYPHPHVPARENPKLDTFIEAHNGNPSMAFEMKFTVKNVKKDQNVPKSMVFGALISDLIRLHYIPDVEERFLVWVFDRDMGIYLCNRKEPWNDMIKGNTFTFTAKHLEGLPKVTIEEIQKRIGKNIGLDNLRVSTAYARDFNIGNRIFGIRVYNVDGKHEWYSQLETDPCTVFRRKKRERGERKRTQTKQCTRGKYYALATWLRGIGRMAFEISLDELEKEINSISPGFSPQPRENTPHGGAIMQETSRQAVAGSRRDGRHGP